MVECLNWLLLVTGTSQCKNIGVGGQFDGKMAVIVRQELSEPYKQPHRASRASLTAVNFGPDLHCSARLLLIFGKIIGLLPISFTCTRIHSTRSVLTGIFMVLLSINAAFSLFILIKNFYFQVPEYSLAPHVWIFYTSGAFA